LKQFLTNSANNKVTVGVAQLVDHSTTNHEIKGSNPVARKMVLLRQRKFNETHLDNGVVAAPVVVVVAIFSLG
jgi:hypothetical protein